MELVIYVAIVVLLCIGLYGIMTQKNMIKLVICFNVIESTILLFLLVTGYKPGGTYPIIRPGEEGLYVDPLPHSLALTAIVIGASTTALMLAFIIKLYKTYGTLEIDKIRRLKG